MDKVNLSVELRDVEKTRANTLRLGGMIPAIIYGAKKENLTVMVKFNDFVKAYRLAGTNTIVELDFGGGKKENVLIGEVDQNPITDEPQHIDFLWVDMSKKVNAKVPLEFVGLAKAVKDLGGVFNTNIDELEVSCLPTDLPKVIQIDISPLNTFDDGIYIKDVVLPKGVEIDRQPDELVVSVVPPRSEEELKELDAEVTEDVQSVDVEKKGKEDELKEGEEKKEETGKEGEKSEKK